ncbi:uncharacterized protein PV07_02980 [Cladophialophora immunda]|uniref:aldehyde dehydrogenase (NAD(+)) n=1 Tax=Cladophialophora immunda TaxID=569365 RepID=A0A0D2CJJ6_9EURO|nr:uncharacterized protein PV07_02980 [Cladophialophora immunda]KIW31323.1 hypothetical protein PV07_02980 [Cladophialophora immunda]OQV06219.1 hypothetical protein CLAIMM_10823 [Cladophialophora immunda]
MAGACNLPRRCYRMLAPVPVKQSRAYSQPIRPDKQFYSFANLINGRLRHCAPFQQAINPSTKEALWDVPIATESDLNAATAAATEVFRTWSRTPWARRQDGLKKAKSILDSAKQDFAALLSWEGGKPIQFAALEVEQALAILDFHATHEPLEDRLIQDDDELRLTLRYAPMGTVAAICPWNFPLALAMSKVCAALLTGNCVIVKPSPFTPYSVLKFAELVKDLFPPGVLQTLNGDEKLGPLMCSHPDIQKISFTGSIATGKRIVASTASTLKRVTLELGGNSASIVCPDVDPAVVAPQIAMGAFFNSGQLCVASKRIYVHNDIYDEFLEAMVGTVRSWVVGETSDLQPGTMLGPVQNENQYNVVRGFFKDAEDNGYKFALGSPIDADASARSKSFLIRPAIIDNPPDESMIVRGEPFGPIVPVLRWDDEEEIIKRANDTNTGLGGAVWSADVDRAHAIAERIEAGTVWINGYERPLAQAYCAGQKESGLGGELGTEGLRGFCNAQTVHYYKTPVAGRRT